MTNVKCDVCGADIVPATSFCRQCGAAISARSALDPSEQPTAVFPENEIATTQRLNPRPTKPERNLSPSAQKLNVGSAVWWRGKFAVGAIALVLVIVGLLAVIVTLRTANKDTVSQPHALTYPGAETVVDLTSADGSRAIHLRTRDPFARVENWYQSNLKLSKTMRLTSTSVVMKNEKVTITLAEEEKVTNILIKTRP